MEQTLFNPYGWKDKIIEKRIKKIKEYFEKRKYKWNEKIEEKIKNILGYEIQDASAYSLSMAEGMLLDILEISMANHLDFLQLLEKIEKDYDPVKGSENMIKHIDSTLTEVYKTPLEESTKEALRDFFKFTKEITPNLTIYNIFQLYLSDYERFIGISVLRTPKERNEYFRRYLEESKKEHFEKYIRYKGVR